MKYFWAYLILINALSFLLMLVDKFKAKKKLWRIPEATLMGGALLGGSVGALLGMYLARHKTRHPKFAVGIPVILAFQLAVLIFLFLRNRGWM